MSSRHLNGSPGGKLTKEFLFKLCSKDEGMYTVPHLNNILYLHYQGIKKIENLEEYINVKCLYLQNNLISKIENLDGFKNLVLLFLNDNCIDKIENLDCLKNLDKLDLGHNSIKKIENLSGLSSLTNLDLSHNQLASVADVTHLKHCPGLTLLRLSHNRLDDPAIITVLSTLQKMRALFLDGNPLIGQISHYRKKVIVQFPELCYLDTRPVKDQERSLAEAWRSGGESAEELLQLEWKVQSDLETRQLHLKLFDRMQQRYPELYQENSENSEELTEEGDSGIKLPWHLQFKLQQRQQPLVQEVEDTVDEPLQPQVVEFGSEEEPLVHSRGKRLIIQEIDDQSINNLESNIVNSSNLSHLDTLSQVCIEDEAKEKAIDVETKQKVEDQSKTRIPEELTFSLEQRMLQNNFVKQLSESAELPSAQHVADLLFETDQMFITSPPAHIQHQLIQEITQDDDTDGIIQ